MFTYEEWLSRTRGPKRTMICEMAAVVDEELMVELTTYVIQVKTSDVAGETSAGSEALDTERLLNCRSDQTINIK